MKRIGVILVLGAVSLMFGYNVKNFMLSSRDPYIYDYAVAEPAQIKQGEYLRVAYGFDHIRFCDETLARFIQNDRTGEVIFRDRVPGGATSLGSGKRVINSIELIDAPKGHYTLRLTVNAKCSDGLHDFAAPEVKFEIV